MIIVFPAIFRWFFPEKTRAFAFYPLIVVKSTDYKNDVDLLNHERIHHRQQLELLIIPFYFLYYGEMMVRWFQLRNLDEAYRAISFEREAYDHHNKPEYLKSRKPYAMWRN